MMSGILPLSPTPIMHGLRLLLALVLVPLFATAAQAQATRTLSHTVPLDRDGRVSIDTHKGSVTIETWDRAEAAVEIEIEGDDADQVERTQIDVRADAGHLRLKTDYDDAQPAGLFSFISGGSVELPETHYRLHVPRSARISIDDHKSDIRVADVSAPLNVQSHKGHIVLRRIDGDLHVESHKGQMRIDEVTGRFTLDTHKGEADVRGLRGPLRVDTHKGEVHVAFADYQGARVETHKGFVRLALPPGSGFDLNADLDDDGDLRADFDLTSLRRGDPRDDDRRYRGSVNGGGPRLDLDTHKGTFAVRLR